MRQQNYSMWWSILCHNIKQMKDKAFSENEDLYAQLSKSSVENIFFFLS
jgi:hypothetical protein